MKTSGPHCGQCEYREVWQKSGSIQRRLGKGLGPSADREVPSTQDRWFTRGGPWPVAAAAPGNLLDEQILRPHPDILSQKLRRWDGAVCAETSFSDDSEACLPLRTTGFA